MDDEDSTKEAVAGVGAGAGDHDADDGDAYDGDAYVYDADSCGGGCGGGDCGASVVWRGGEYGDASF